MDCNQSISVLFYILRPTLHYKATPLILLAFGFDTACPSLENIWAPHREAGKIAAELRREGRTRGCGIAELNILLPIWICKY